MPIKCPIERAIYMKEYNIKHRVKLSNNHKIYQDENRWRIRKLNIKSQLKARGMTFQDYTFEEVWERKEETTHCDYCHELLIKKEIEHNHLTGHFRGIVCHRCNIKLGYADKKFKKVKEEIKKLLV
tara:strand:- start:7250 stop:7627 length:378 start_codon:yes stop_codon:yes gene_type:complete